MKRRSAIFWLASISAVALLIIWIGSYRSLKEPPSVDESPTSQSTAGKTAQSTDSISPSPADQATATLNKVFQELRPGQIVFNPPAQMRVAEIKVIVVRISDDLRRDLTAGLGANPITAKIRVGSFLKASLSGTNFKTEPLSELNQALPKGGEAQWQWNVTPTQSGEQTLSLTVYVRIKLPDQPEETVYLGSYERNINVRVNPQYILAENWKWIIENWPTLTAIIGGILTVIALQRKRLIKRCEKIRPLK